MHRSGELKCEHGKTASAWECCWAICDQTWYGEQYLLNRWTFHDQPWYGDVYHESEHQRCIYRCASEMGKDGERQSRQFPTQLTPIFSLWPHRCTVWKKCWHKCATGMTLSAAHNLHSTCSSSSVCWALGLAWDQVGIFHTDKPFAPWFVSSFLKHQKTSNMDKLNDPHLFYKLCDRGYSGITMSVCRCVQHCPENIYWTTQPFVTKLGVVIHDCELECQANKLYCYYYNSWSLEIKGDAI